MGDELKETKNLFNLTKDENSVFYRVEKIKNNQLKKANKSNYPKDQVLSKLYNHRKILINNIMILFQVIHCLLNKKKIDYSAIFSIQFPFDILHANIADIRFLAKSAVDPKYCPLFVDLFTSKIYAYPMKKGNLLKKSRNFTMIYITKEI